MSRQKGSFGFARRMSELRILAKYFHPSKPRGNKYLPHQSLKERARRLWPNPLPISFNSNSPESSKP